MKTLEDIEALYLATFQWDDGVYFAVGRYKRRGLTTQPYDGSATPDETETFWRVELFQADIDLQDGSGDGPTAQAAIDALYAAVEARADEKVAKIAAAKGGRS